MRGNSQIDDSMLSLHAKQMRCSKRTLKKLLSDQASKEDYFKELLQGGHISQEEYNVLCGTQ